jgi:hypothetical protein
MTALTPRIIAAATVLILIGSSTGSAQSNPCELLTTAEVNKLVARGRPTYNQAPDLIPIFGGAGVLCEYGFGGQIGVWSGPKTSDSFDRFLKQFRMDKVTRHPVSGVGDRAWIIYPVRENKNQDRMAYLVTNVGQKILTVALFARDGQADGMMGDICRGDQKGLKPDEKEECKKVLADKSETQESLKPAVIELAKLVVEKVRAGR